MGKKIDNADLPAKLQLRRRYLRFYHDDGNSHVLDCCQGDGVIWSELRRDFPVRSYLGLDVKEKRGRLKIEAERFLAQRGWSHNVIDIDCYGAPWKYWCAMLPNISQPTTVFITIGFHTNGMDRLSQQAADVIGVGPLLKRLPAKFQGRLQDLSADAMLADAARFVDISDALQITAKRRVGSRPARYIGVRLSPKAA